MTRLVPLTALLALAVAACAGSGVSSERTSPLPPVPSTVLPADSSPRTPDVPSTPTPTDSPAAPAITGAAGATGISFLDPEGLYRMTIGEGWEARHGAFAEGIEVWLTQLPVDGFAPNVNVLTQPVGTITLDAYSEQSMRNAPALIRDFELIDLQTVTAPTGVELAVVDYTGLSPSDAPLRFLAVWTIHDGTAIVATFTAPPDAVEAQRDTMLDYLLTLEPA